MFVCLNIQSFSNNLCLYTSLQISCYYHILQMKIPMIVCILFIIHQVTCLPMNWGTYEYTNNRKGSETIPKSSVETGNIVLSHPDLANSFIRIQLEHKTSPALISHDYNEFQYDLGANGLLKIITRDKNLYLLVQYGLKQKEKNKQNQIKFSLFLKVSHNVVSSLQEFSLAKIKEKIGLQCQLKEQNGSNIEFECNLNKQSPKFQLNLQFQKQQSSNKWYTGNSNSTTYKTKIHNFMKTHNISQYTSIKSSKSQQKQQTTANIKINNFEIVSSAILSAISSICVDQQGQIGSTDRYTYLGFCFKNKYDYKFTPLVITLLADFDYKLAQTIYMHYLESIEAKVMYPTAEEEQLNMGITPIPEHLDVFMKFVKIDDALRQAKLLNNIFVKCMLNQLSNLHLQVNYREAKKLHPYLMQMLTQSWKYQDNLKAFKSVYEQSLTEDFEYHNYGQKLHQSVTKASWLFKVIDTFSLLEVSFYKNFLAPENLRQHLQEQFSLLNLLQKFLLEDDNARKGDYYDVIEVENGMKFYSKPIGYGNILPYLYVGNAFPKNAFSKLLSEFGLKSSDKPNSEISKKYRFRGDIHSYFNYKILKGIPQKLKDDKSIKKTQKQQINEAVSLLWNSIRNNVLLNYQQQNKIFTSWSINGKGKQSIPWMRIVTILFLKEHRT